MGVLALFMLLFWTPAAVTGTQYSLTGLHPQGISKYAVPERSAQREYLHFTNELGSHRFIYEETSKKPPLAGIAGMRGAMGNSDMVCTADLDCKAKAFCAGRCQNMYYELSNSPEDPALSARNHCGVLAFRCKTGGGQ